MSDVPPAADAAHADIGLVCALKLEVVPLLERCDRVRKYTGGEFVFRGGLTGEDYDIRVVIVEAGTGQERAARATQALIDAHTPNWILSVGFSGALTPELKIGDIVTANSVVDMTGDELKVDVRMTADVERGWHVGRIVTADEIVRTVAEKERLARQTEALAVDLESLAVARLCSAAKMRFLAVRAISDELSEDLPPEVLSVFGGTGSLRAGAIAGALWKRPGSAKDMWRLRERAVTASERLAIFLTGIIPTLAESSRSR
ncbi:MAG: 5'-methylthioadenosine nucleosidase [Planctomycetaceae bacterium]|nr:5'-methylthioadenosine nucleosidase [Planctomycetaceae bacterium]